MTRVRTKIINHGLLLVIIIGLVIRIPSLFSAHLENDEIVYKTLIRNLSLSVDSYTLQGSDALKFLPGYIYDYPIFHHPPTFTILSKIFFVMLGEKGILLLPIFASLVTTYFVWKIALLVFFDEQNKRYLAFYAALIFALDPVSIFVSTKVWSDSLLTMFLTGCLYYSLLQKQDLKFLASLIGAILTKTIAVLVFPVFIVFKIYSKNKSKIWPILLSAVFGVLWLLVYHKYTGIYFLDTRANKQFISMFPYVAKVVNRPVSFYFFQILLLNPIYLFSYYEIYRLATSKESIKSKLFISSMFGILYLALFTVIGALGGSFQMRYILPAFPSLAIVAAKWAGENKMRVALLLTLFIPISIITGLVTTYVLLVADPIPLTMPRR